MYASNGLSTVLNCCSACLIGFDKSTLSYRHWKLIKNRMLLVGGISGLVVVNGASKVSKQVCRAFSMSVHIY